MIAPGLLLALALSSEVPACGAPPKPEAPDPALAELYLATGQEELARGARDTAVAAFQAALARDPSNARAKAELDALCSPKAAGLQRALDLVEHGDCPAALRAIEEARGHDADLVRGVCAYQLGDDAGAAAIFRGLERDPAFADTATLYLALIAQRTGDAAGARARLERLAATEPHSARATEAIDALERAAARDHRLVAAAFVEPGYDSNVGLANDADRAASSTGDGFALATLSAVLRPLGRSGPYLRADGQLLKHLELEAFDLAGIGGSLGWSLDDLRRQLELEYGFFHLVLGGAAFLDVHHVAARGYWSLGHFRLGGEYELDVQRFADPAASGFSGLRHLGLLAGSWNLSRRFVIGAGYAVARDAADAGEVRYFGHGPTLFGRAALGERLLLRGDAGLLLRGYDAPGLGLTDVRSDQVLDGALSAEVKLSEMFTLIASLTGERVWSNLSAFEHTKVTAGLGLGVVEVW